MAGGQNGSHDHPKHILVVDDEDIIRELLSELLGAQGYQVSAAASAEAGLALAQGQAFHAAVVDLTLPGMNGLELSRRLVKQYPGLGVAMMTGWGSTEAAEKEPAIRAIVSKPFDLREMMQVVQRLVEA